MVEKKPTYEELRKQLDDLKKTNQVEFRVGDKGGVSAYNLGGRFPVTLYVEQWERLIDNIEVLKQFLKTNSGKLKRR